MTPRGAWRQAAVWLAVGLCAFSVWYGRHTPYTLREAIAVPDRLHRPARAFRHARGRRRRARPRSGLGPLSAGRLRTGPTRRCSSSEFRRRFLHRRRLSADRPFLSRASASGCSSASSAPRATPGRCGRPSATSRRSPGIRRARSRPASPLWSRTRGALGAHPLLVLALLLGANAAAALASHRRADRRGRLFREGILLLVVMAGLAFAVCALAQAPPDLSRALYAFHALCDLLLIADVGWIVATSVPPRAVVPEELRAFLNRDERGLARSCSGCALEKGGAASRASSFANSHISNRTRACAARGPMERIKKWSRTRSARQSFAAAAAVLAAGCHNDSNAFTNPSGRDVRRRSRRPDVDSDSRRSDADADAGAAPPARPRSCRSAPAAAWSSSIRRAARAPSTIHVGDTVQWVWVNGTPLDDLRHLRRRSCTPDGIWNSGAGSGMTFSHTFSQAGTFPYFCRSTRRLMQGIGRRPVSRVAAGRARPASGGRSRSAPRTGLVFDMGPAEGRGSRRRPAAPLRPVPLSPVAARHNSLSPRGMAPAAARAYPSRLDVTICAGRAFALTDECGALRGNAPLIQSVFARGGDVDEVEQSRPRSDSRPGRALRRARRDRGAAPRAGAAEAAPRALDLRRRAHPGRDRRSPSRARGRRRTRRRRRPRPRRRRQFRSSSPTRRSEISPCI